MKSIYTIILCFLLMTNLAWGQMKPNLETQARQVSPRQQIPELNIPDSWRTGVPAASRPYAGMRSLQDINPIVLLKPAGGFQTLEIYRNPETQLPIFIKGKVKYTSLNHSGKSAIENQCLGYLKSMEATLGIKNADRAFSVKEVRSDTLNRQHVRLQQLLEGIPVYGGEIMLHLKNDQVYLFNGRYFPVAGLASNTATLFEAAALQVAMDDVQQYHRISPITPEHLEWMDVEPNRGHLVVFYSDDNTAHLCWQLDIFPNFMARWTYLVDAHTGEILRKFSQICQMHPNCTPTNKKHDNVNFNHPNSTFNLRPSIFDIHSSFPPDGPAVANAQDLFGNTRTINTYELGNNFFMIDASRQMHIANQSVFPNDAVGVVMTIDAENQTPQNDDFSAVHVTSSNNVWNNPTAVSAHHHAGIVYEYFRQTHSRNAINGTGGNIISFINVTDENGDNMDNAFWNGAFMFYGNGDIAFNAPLAKALDVTGHEFTHGVIQSTANLEYFGESGAINESMADAFGVMIDRSDFQLGEDIANSEIFPTGAMRDMENPHNGGNSLNDNGYQPQHVNEQFFGSEDNGGVHINSGIPNRAFASFANAVGKDKAERVYYKALRDYLTRSSQFIDLRLAVIQAADELYGNTEVNAAAAAFDLVGITNGEGSNTGEDLETNVGSDFILYTNENQNNLYTVNAALQLVFDPLTTISPISKPSVTDDGSIIVYIASDNTMRFVQVNWSDFTGSQGALSSDPIWHNVAISKDGNRLAAVTTDFDNRIFVFDLTQDPTPSTEFELFNPTTVDGVATGDVAFADVLEWDYGGAFLMYDALNEVNTNAGNLDYWDIGFIRVWNNSSNNFGDGFITKLFSGLPENTSVGNPTFSKNSPYIISFDLFDEFEDDYFIMGANIETGDIGTIWQNFDLGYPSYSVEDDQIIFDASDSFGDRVIGIADLASDKINRVGDASVFIDGGFFGARWGTWFGTGNRVFTDTESLDFAGQPMKVYPNPAGEVLNLELEMERSDDLRVIVYDLLGIKITEQVFPSRAGTVKESLNIGQLFSGTYLLQLHTENSTKVVKFVKE